jgi:hypothetical protein
MRFRLRFSLRTLFVAIAAVACALDGGSGYAGDLDAPSTGTLKGRFVYDGPSPDPQLITPTLNEQVFSKYRIVDESLLVPRILGIQNIFIWVSSKDIPIPKHDKLDPVTIEFKEGRFAPHAIAFQEPCDLILNNEESLECVFYRTTADYAFAVQARPKHQHTVNMLRPDRMPAKLVSNFPWTCSWLLALPHPYFAVSNEGGEFKIDNLPPGTWEFQVWHERKGFLETADWKRGRFTLEIKPGENDLGVIKIDPKFLEKK